MDIYLVISALGPDKRGIVHDITKIIFDNHCNISNSKMMILGGEFSVIIMSTGHWNHIAKLEDALTQYQQSNEITIATKRTHAQKKQSDLVPYSIEIISMDQIGIIYQVSKFLANFDSNIQELTTERYFAPHTGIPMFAINMTVNIPAEIRISDLREQFTEYCDGLNLDAVLEPVTTKG